ncbi:FimV N-terminal domain-containing protein [Microbulbifer donghaiensis]|uniref:FimV N-terminal domain-containing protein n=1 Tax=Microbulbifer donghaiensis TaxID=494016 RepID=A0A1M4WZE0_9GAMM|nr:FimV/HubP family polar landmark protein [Microbulbifer donghaiensis]SHE86631.1 FimV N-terminal domain-containing protein [Microbulbifer donghaiensis]
MDLHQTLTITSRPTTLLAFALQVPLMLASAPSLALGLGNASLKTAVGYPLAVEIPILDRSASLDASQVRVRQVLGRGAEQMGYDLAADAQPFSISVSEMPGGLTIQVKSSAPLNEPFVSFVLELSWPGGTLYRDYNLLVDLPPITPPTATAAPTQLASPAAQTPASIAAAVPVKSASPAAQSRAPADPAYTGNQWRVEPGQNLWRIARRVQPDSSIPLDAVMAAIHARNPHAFLNGDMNRLQAGALLDLPSAADYSAPPATASRPAAAAPAPVEREPSPATADTPSPAALAEETPQARLRLSGRPTETSDSRVVRPGEQIDAIKEQLDKVNRENEQLRQQIQRIEASDYMAVMQEMLQLQEQRILELKAQMDASAAAKVEADSTGTSPGGIIAAVPPAEPAPATARDTGPSYAALLLLILTGIAGGVALSQLLDWWRRRRTATEYSPESDALSFDPLTADWGGVTGRPASAAPAPCDPQPATGPAVFIFPPPAPEADAAKTEESGVVAASGEEEGQEIDGSPATPGPDSLFEELQLDESFDQDSADLPAQRNPASDDDLALDFAAFDPLPLEELDPTAAGPAPDAAENGDADVISAISVERGMAAAGDKEERRESADSAASPSPVSLFGEMQLEEPFDLDFADLSAQSSTPNNDYLVLEFAAIDQLPLDEIDPLSGAATPAAPAPGTAESDDAGVDNADAKKAISEAVV